MSKFVFKPDIREVDYQGNIFHVRGLTADESRISMDESNKHAFILKHCLVDENGNNFLSDAEAKELLVEMPAKCYFTLSDSIDDLTLTDKTKAKVQEALKKSK